MPLVWCLLLAALAMISVGMAGVYENHQLSRWRETQGIVLRSDIDTLEPNHAVVSVEYEYSVDGTTHDGQDFHRYEARRRDQWALQFARTFANDQIKRNSPGANITVFYDPHQPKSSSISRPSSDNTALAASAFLGQFVLLLSVWGLYFRRFAFGTCWIAITLILASILSGAPVYYSVEWARTAHSDGAGFAVIGGMLMAVILFFVCIVGSSIAYGVYWRRRFRSIRVAAGPDGAGDATAGKLETQTHGELRDNRASDSP
jgi:hypothetical protein